MVFLPKGYLVSDETPVLTYRRLSTTFIRFDFGTLHFIKSIIRLAFASMIYVDRAWSRRVSFPVLWQFFVSALYIVPLSRLRTQVLGLVAVLQKPSCELGLSGYGFRTQRNDRTGRNSDSCINDNLLRVTRIARSDPPSVEREKKAYRLVRRLLGAGH